MTQSSISCAACFHDDLTVSRKRRTVLLRKVDRGASCKRLLIEGRLGCSIVVIVAMLLPDLPTLLALERRRSVHDAILATYYARTSQPEPRDDCISDCAGPVLRRMSRGGTASPHRCPLPVTR